MSDLLRLSFREPQWALVVLLALVLCGIAIMARLAGWHRLAEEFPATAIPPGEGFRFLTASMGSPHFPIRYRHCLHLVVAEQGLYLSLMFPFRFHSPAVWLPWAAVATLAEKQSISSRTCTVEVRRHWPTITLAGPAGQAVVAAYRRAVGEPATATGPGPV